jgi:hypothetical protein
MKQKTIYLLLLIFIQCVMVNSQTNVPTIKDPRVEAFTIFGDVPVSHTTGVPDISIPLFNIESHGYTLPVTLRYHTAMVKPPYDHTNVATGWILEVGGSVVQNIKKENDFMGLRPADWKNDYDLADPTSSETQMYVVNAYNKVYDCEYDIFSYSFPGSSGQFVLDKESTGKYGVTSLSDPGLKGNISVTVSSSSGSYTINSLVLKADNGYRYSYEKKTYDQVWTNLSKKPYYMLDTIYSPNGNRLFNFSYSRYYNATTQLSFRNYILSKDWIYVTSPYETIPEDPNPIYSTYESHLLDEDWVGSTINKVGFDNGSLDFTLTDNNRHIEKITLKDLDGKPVKEVVFQVDSFPGSGYRCLDKVILEDKNSAEISKYSFDYYNKTYSVNNSTLNLDYFGYLTLGYRPSGLLGKFIDIGEKTFSYSYITHAGIVVSRNITLGQDINKEPNLNMTETYALKSVTYPTGGKTELVYGLNQYVDHYVDKYQNPCIKTGGGLRVEKIINYDISNNQTSVKTYEYEPGSVNFSFSNDGDNFRTNYSFSFGRTEFMYINNDIINPEKNKEIRYGKVTEFSGDTGSNVGKTVYEYTFSNPHVYRSLAEIYNQDELILGGSMWEYISEYRNWDNGQLTQKTAFKNNGSGYDTVSVEKSTYVKTDLKKYNNLQVYQYASYGTGSADVNQYEVWKLIDSIKPTLNPAVPLIPYNYAIVAGVSRLTSKTTTLYNNNTPVSTTEQYYYNNGMDKFMTGKNVTNSDAETQSTFYKYPYDSTSDVTNEMTNRNMISPVIEEITQVNGTQVKGTKPDYGFVGSDGSLSDLSSAPSASHIVPSAVYQWNKSGFYEKELALDRYDDLDNLLLYHKRDNISTFFIWGYNKQYPVAKIEGATYDEVKAALGGMIPDLGSGTLTASQVSTLRSSLSSALVTTYTYRPLVGMTSATAPNGVTTYYEYDTFNRLKRTYIIENGQQKTIQSYDYHYQGQ